MARAKTADQHNLDLIAIQDHPHNRNFFETWTLMITLATAIERIDEGAAAAASARTRFGATIT